MRILCLSDTHIGAGYDHRADALADTDAMFDQVLSLAADRGVDLVLHAGDVFHRAKPSPAELHCFKRFCDGLALIGVPMVAIGGNGLHEAAPGQRSALELFAGRLVEVCRVPKVIPVAGATVCTLPSASLSWLVAATGGGDRAQLQEQAVELLLRLARDLFSAADPAKPRVLLAHQMVSGASLPTGLPVEQVGSVVLPLEALEAIGFDAIVLGDIHAQQILPASGDTWVWYCGSPMTHDFGEQDTEHGCWIYEPTKPAALYPPEFVPLARRRFVTVDISLAELPDTMLVKEIRNLADGGEEVTWYDADVEPLGDETDAIAAAIAAEFPLQDAVLRVRYRATEEQHRRVDQAALLRLIADAGAHKLYGGLQWEPVREQRTRAEGLDESLGPLAALGLWLAAEGVDGAAADGLRELLAGWEAA